MRGNLSRLANGFRCMRCDGTIQEADLAEDLQTSMEVWVDNNNIMVGRETYGGVR